MQGLDLVAEIEAGIEERSFGQPAGVDERFAAAGVAANKISFAKRTYDFDFAGTPSELLTLFITFYGPTMNAFEAARKAGREADLHAELTALFDHHNTSPTSNRTCIAATFLHVTVSP